MPNYLWLVWHNLTGSRMHKHWVLMLTYEPDEEAYGTIYHVFGDGIDGFGPYISEKIRHAQLELPLNHSRGRFFLGYVSDDVVESLDDYCKSATELINSKNSTRASGGGAKLICQDWALMIIESLEDARILAVGATVDASRCPRKA